MKLSGTERETIVLYNEAEAAASIYTHNAALCRQLSELCGTYPGQVRQTGTMDMAGFPLNCRKNGYASPRPVSLPLHSGRCWIR